MIDIYQRLESKDGKLNKVLRVLNPTLTNLILAKIEYQEAYEFLKNDAKPTDQTRKFITFIDKYYPDMGLCE